MLEPLFNKVAGCACVFADKKLQHRYLLVNSAKVSRPFILYNTCDRLLLLSVFTIYFSFKCFLTVTHSHHYRFLYPWYILSLFKCKFLKFSFMIVHFYNRAVEKRGGGRGGVAEGTPSQCFLEQNFFSHVKSENIAFSHVNNVSDFSLFVEQDISDKK